MARSSINFVSKSQKGQMGNALREKPNQSKESAYKCTTFGIEQNSQRSLYDLKWPPRCLKKLRFTNKTGLGKSS